MLNLEDTKLICLMPTYNKQETLTKAIKSVMMQKTDFKYKLLILDDCSSDNSNDIALEYKKQYPDKIEIIRNEQNLRLLKTITNAYSLLKGVDYFCVLDADDWYTYDEKFHDAVEFLEKNSDYSIYMTNVTLLQNNVEKPLLKTNKNSIDFDYDDYKNGKGAIVQTSGVIYRNVYFKDGMNNQFLDGSKSPYGEALRADGFRTIWHLKKGKAHFVNHCESIYNYNNEGIWAGLTAFEQNLLNARLNYAFSIFFPDEKDSYLRQVKKLYNSAIEGFRISDKKYLEKYYSLIFYIYLNTYLSDNPIFENKDLDIENNFFEKIFSVKNTPNQMYKILTILGFKFKLKRGGHYKN